MRIHLISGPRNISTALMYSFAQRADTTVVDEPFYAHYLVHTGVDHPGRTEVLAAQPNDYKDVIAQSVYGQYATKHVFIKNMAHHLLGVPEDFLADCQNLFLIRDPKALIASLALVVQNPVIRDTGLAESARLFKHLQQKTGKTPVVINSGVLLQNPAKYLAAVCDALVIPFDKNMLQWPAGSIAADGIWAKYWYDSVHKSTGFAPQRSETRPLPAGLEPLLEEALVHYNFLNNFAIKV